MTDSYNFFNLRAFSESNQPYACNDWVVFQEKAYKSKKPENNRHPHDSDYWDEIGLVSGLLDHLLQDNRAIDLSVTFYPECSNGCVAMFDKGGCVIDKVPVLNEDGTQKKDDCGQLVFELMIFTSLVDCNTDAPQDGASKDDPTWDGGYTVCAYLNRPVAYTQDGNAPENWLKPEAPQNLKCVMDCSAPDGETIALAEQGESGTHSSPVGNKLRVIHDNKSIITTPEKGLEVAVIGKSISGEPVDIREDPCLVTCDDMGNGLWHNQETNKFEVKPADHSVTVDSEGVRVNISDGLELTDDGVRVKPADDSIEVTPEGIQVKVIGTDIADKEIDVQEAPCFVTCQNVDNDDFYVEKGQLRVTKQCDIIVNPAFEIFCRATAGAGTPNNQLVIDTSASTGAIESRAVYWSPNYDGSNFTSAIWYPLGVSEVIYASDPELIANGGTVRLTVRNKHCGYQHLIRLIKPCCESVKPLFYSNIGQSSGAICHPVNLASGVRHIQMDKDPSIFPGYEGQVQPYSRIVVTNTSNCAKRFKVKGFVSLHRADDTADGIGGGFGGIPQTRALLQTRMGIDGDPYLDRVYFHNLYGSYDAGQWLLERSIDESFSGYFNYGSYSDFGDTNPSPGVVTITNHDMEIVLNAGETKTLAMKMHVYWEQPLDPEDSNFNSIERLHFASNIIAHEVI